MTRALLWLVVFAWQAGTAMQGRAVTDDEEAVAPFESLIKADKLAEAQSALEGYTAQHVRSWRAQYQLGYVYFRLHRFQPSVERLCKSLLIKDDFAEAHKILAYDLNIMGHPDRAMVELERSIKIDPKIAESQYELGRLYYEEGAYLQAIAHLETAKALSPESVRTYHNLGLAYAAVSENSKAMLNFEEGLRRNNQQAKPSAWPLIDYGTFWNLEGEFQKAKAMLMQAIALDPQWDQAYGELAKADKGLGQLDEAIQALRKAVQLNGHKPEYHYVLWQLYKQTNRLPEAEEELVSYRRARSQGVKP